jgi:DNA-binding NarL/FixJ family response regulator/tetratricopeptide (TPR) repeat protein
MHWADRSTRTFVSFLARSLRRERVMLLLTYRADELHRRHPLRPLLSELERLERARRVDVLPFDRGELAEVLADILGDQPGPDLLERLFVRSEGNPLYTEELLAAGLDGRGAPPQSLRDAFMLRIEQLSLEAQQAARAVAVGRRLEQDVISEVAEIGAAALQAALREAVAEQVLVPAEDGRIVFRHALLREVVYDDLLPGERSDLHLRLAHALEQRPQLFGGSGVELAATVASHYAAAGDQPAALRASIEAARAAEEIQAVGEAADLAERALELWPRVPDAAEIAGLDHVDLLVLAARMHALTGNWSRAEVLLHSSLEELDERRDAVRYSYVLYRLGRTQWVLNQGIKGVETAQRALALLPAGEASTERVLILAWLARTRVLRGRFRDAIGGGMQALDMARSLQARFPETELLNTLGMARIALGQVEEGMAHLREAIELARAENDIDSLGYAYANLADMLNLRGRTAEGLEVAREGRAAIPSRYRPLCDWMELQISELAFELGDWVQARERLGPGPGPAGTTLDIFRLTREADMALGEGDEDAAEQALDAVAPLIEASSEPQWIGLTGALLGELRRRRRDLEGARAAVAAALDRLELCTDDVMRIARVSGIGLRVEADMAQRARDLRERAQERDALARARIHMERLRAAAQEGGPIERAWMVNGTAELARARGRNAPAGWHKAAREWEAVHRPYPTAVARWRAAEAAVERGERDAAAEALRAALADARRLGSRWLIREVTGLGERARLSLDSNSAAAGDGAGAPPPEAAPDPFGLTARERQVLALIAEGATNRQIGASLFMAEKTASVHVSRILAKLGVSSRTQAAALAHRQHLT